MNLQDMGPVVLLALCAGIVIGWLITVIALRISDRRSGVRQQVERGEERRRDDLGPEARRQFRSGEDRRQQDDPG